MMTKIFKYVPPVGQCEPLDGMFRDRKRTFVDMMKWDLPIVDGEFEIDQFDTAQAVYILAIDVGAARHLGSIRLLPTDGPHLLGDIFPSLCGGNVPAGPTIWEISRGCLSPDLPRGSRMEVRDALTMAAALFALKHGISTYSCIADGRWLKQIPLLGWRCAPLGPETLLGRSRTGALRVEISNDTPGLLEQTRRARSCAGRNALGGNAPSSIHVLAA